MGRISDCSPIFAHHVEAVTYILTGTWRLVPVGRGRGVRRASIRGSACTDLVSQAEMMAFHTLKSLWCEMGYLGLGGNQTT